MPAIKIKNLIFDWSGTLFNDFDASYISTNATLKHFGVKAIKKELYRNEFNLPAWTFYRKYIPRASFKDIDHYYFDHFTPISFKHGKLYPQTKEILKTAKRKGFRVFLCSSVRQSLLEDKVKKYGLSSYFEKIYGSVANKKKVLPQICKTHHLKKSETLYIGDMEHDIQAAKASQIKSASVFYGYHSQERLLAHRPDFIWNDQVGILKFIQFQQEKRQENKRKWPISTVGGLIFNQGDVLIIQTHKWGHSLGIPGGKIEYLEPSLQALKREMLEETGLRIHNIRWAMIHDSIDSNEYYKKGSHFLLLNYYAESRSRKVKLNNEAESYIWIQPEKALKLNLNEPTRVLIKTYLKGK